jgi:flagellar protein FliS
VVDLNRAIAAMRSNNVELRCKELKHALLILQQLEGSLDHERGGDAARNLEALYSYARAQVMEAQLKMEPALLEKLAMLFLDVKTAWQQVDPARAKAASANQNVTRQLGDEERSGLSCTV